MSHIEELKAYFVRKFKRFVVALEPIPSEPELIGVAVYGVPKDEIAWVRQEIFDTEDSAFSGLGLGLIPMVRSRETTEKYYPELLSSWNLCASGLRAMTCHFDFTHEIADYLKPQDTPASLTADNPVAPANTQLLLAA